MTKFSEYLKPNRKNLLITLVGFGLYYIFNFLIYNPLYYHFYSSSYSLPEPFEYAILKTLFELLNFYLIGCIALYLAEN